MLAAVMFCCCHRAGLGIRYFFTSVVTALSKSITPGMSWTGGLRQFQEDIFECFAGTVCAAMP
jgi:hypothetical protein